MHLQRVGGGQLSTEAGVSKKGYVAASKSDYTEFQTTTTPDTSDITSMKATMSMKITNDKKVITEITMTAIITTAEDGTPDGLAVKLYSNIADTKATMEAYYTEGNCYFKIVSGKETKKYKVVTPETNLGNSELANLLNEIDLEELVNTFLTALDSVDEVNAEGITFEKAIKGDNRRFHIGITTEATNSQSDVYVEFQGTKLVGIETISTSTSELMGGTSNTKFAVNKFEGKIKFPSFKGYEEVTEDVVDEIMTGLIGG